MCAVRCIALIARQTSKPSRPGSITSRITISGSSVTALLSPCSPLRAVMTTKCSAVSPASNSVRFDEMSSTIRTRVAIREVARLVVVLGRGCAVVV